MTETKEFTCVVQALWSRAGEARELRQLVDNVKLSELEIAAAEADASQQHWSMLVSQQVS